MKAAYYNEIDPKAAAWLRELIKGGHIAPGEVDERSIENVPADELVGFTQCHFFAGIGVWSYALRRAGWPDDRPVWTGSCPCQPFSDAGDKRAFSDERHLWPAFFRLIRQRRPLVVFGEQVASKVALDWLDHVSADVEREGYAIGALDLCAAGVGAPHIRQRLFWVAHSGQGGRAIERPPRLHADRQSGDDDAGRGAVGGLGYASSGGRGELGDAALAGGGGHADGADGSPGGLADAADANGRGRERGEETGVGTDGERGRGSSSGCADGDPGPTNGHWRASDWLYCRDGRWRPVEPGTSPLVTGTPARVGRLRGYGNSINAEVAQEFIGAYMTAIWSPTQGVPT